MKNILNSPKMVIYIYIYIYINEILYKYIMYKIKLINFKNPKIIYLKFFIYIKTNSIITIFDLLIY